MDANARHNSPFQADYERHARWMTRTIMYLTPDFLQNILPRTQVIEHFFKTEAYNQHSPVCSMHLDITRSVGHNLMTITSNLQI